MRKVCDSDFGGKEYEGECKEKKCFKYIILDNSGSVALFGSENDYRLPKVDELNEEIVVDKVVAELNDQLTTIEEIKGEEKTKYNIDVYVAKVNKKDDVNVKWVAPEEALKIISVFKRGIESQDYDRKFEILEDENALRDYIIKYIY